MPPANTPLTPKGYRDRAKRMIDEGRRAVVRGGKAAREGRCKSLFSEILWAERVMGSADADMASAGISRKDPLMQRFQRVDHGRFAIEQRFRKACLR